MLIMNWMDLFLVSSRFAASVYFSCFFFFIMDNDGNDDSLNTGLFPDELMSRSSMFDWHHLAWFMMWDKQYYSFCGKHLLWKLCQVCKGDVLPANKRYVFLDPYAKARNNTYLVVIVNNLKSILYLIKLIRLLQIL